MKRIPLTVLPVSARTGIKLPRVSYYYFGDPGYLFGGDYGALPNKTWSRPRRTNA